MLSTNFVKLVLIAVLIAFPLAFWMRNNWLHDFEYRISIGFDLFLVAGASVILITNCIDNYFSGNKSSSCKSCKELENVVMM